MSFSFQSFPRVLSAFRGSSSSPTFASIRAIRGQNAFLLAGLKTFRFRAPDRLTSRHYTDERIPRLIGRRSCRSSKSPALLTFRRRMPSCSAALMALAPKGRLRETCGTTTIPHFRGKIGSLGGHDSFAVALRHSQQKSTRGRKTDTRRSRRDFQRRRHSFCSPAVRSTTETESSVRRLAGSHVFQPRRAPKPVRSPQRSGGISAVRS